MSDTAVKKRNGVVSLGLLQFAGWLVVTLLVAGIAYGAFTAKHEAAVEEIKHLRLRDEKASEKLEDVRERMVRVETRQEAQGVTLDRIDKVLQDWAKNK